jgi:hypothetical protein
MRIDSGMFSEFSVRGVWDVPGKTSNQTSGTLRFSNTGIELQLDNAFFIADLVSAWTPGCFKAPVVVGRANDGGKWTIVDARFSGWDKDEPILIARSLLRGECILDVEALPLRKAVLEFTHLEDWAGMRVQVEKDDSGAVSASAPDIPEILMHVPDVRGLGGLTLDSGVSQSLDPMRVTFTRRCRFHVEFDSITSLSSVTEIMRQLSGLLTILVGRAVYPKSAELLVQSSEKSKDLPIEYFLALRAGALRERSDFQMTLPFKMLKNFGAEAFFTRWFSSEEALRPVTDLLLATIYNASPYPQSTFLSLAQAMESFHRRSREGSYVSAADYEEIRKQMLASIPNNTDKKLKTKLQGMVEWGNELSLKDRLRDLFQGVDPEKLRDLSGESNPKRFAELICEVRNYLTHYKGRKPKVINSVPELYNLNQRMRSILVLMVFKYLGISEDAIFLSLKGDLGLVM